MLKRRQFLPYLTLMREEQRMSKHAEAGHGLARRLLGCHMSFLDMDERLLALAGKADLVYSPLVDAKEFPADVDITLVEGAVSSEEDLHKIKMVRERTKILVSLGDCAVTANVPGDAQSVSASKSIYDRAYRENVTFDPGIPDQVVPALLPHSRPVHEVVHGRCIRPGLPAFGRH